MTKEGGNSSRINRVVYNVTVISFNEVQARDRCDYFVR